MKYSPKVPETKEEVIERFNEYPDKFIAECMIELFEVRLLQGDTVMQAYETTLRVVVEPDAPPRCLCDEIATINNAWCETRFPDTGRG